MISTYFEDSAFTAFKRDATFLTRYVNEAPLILSREGIGMANLFCPYQQAKFRPEAVVLFFSEQRDASEKIKLCKLMGAEIRAQRAIFFRSGFRSRSSRLRRSYLTHALDLLCLKRKIREYSQSRKRLI